MLLCNCQGSLCIGLEAEQRPLAIVWGRQHALAARRRFKLIVRRRLLELVKCSRKKIFIRGAFGFIFLRRSLAFDLSLFCLSFFDHVIALIQASGVSIRSRKYLKENGLLKSVYDPDIVPPGAQRQGCIVILRLRGRLATIGWHG